MTTAGSADSDEVNATRWDVFLGYSWIGLNQRRGSTLPVDKSITPGFAVSAAYFANKYAGLELLSSPHFGKRETISNTTIGPIVRYPMKGLSPFAHIGAGFSQLSPSGLGNDIGVALRAGGGFDLAFPNISWLRLRVIQADYVYSHHRFAGYSPHPEFHSAELSSGIVIGSGSIKPPIPPTVACAVNPTEVFAGEPVNVTVTPSNFNPKRTVTYSYTATGGKVNGNAASTTVDTKDAQPGNYTVTANGTDGKMKVPASCSSSFTVKEWPVPTVSCTANPTEVDAGQTSTVNCNGSTNKGNLKYNYTASAGTINGEGPNATLNTAGAAPGPITVTGTVTDDRGKTANANATVTVRQPVAPPPPPPPPQSSKINEIAFTKPYASRVDNTAKAVLDDVALRLQREPDSKAVIIGETDPSETSKARSKNLAALRSVNAKAYLVDEKGIDASRIETRTGTTGGMKSEIWIVPNGATFNEPDTQVTNMSPAKAAPARRAHHARRKAQ